MMRKLYVLLVGLLLGSAPVLAQGEKQSSVSATVTPTALPGEERLSAQERAERDFLMPVRRKQAAALRTRSQEEGTTQPALEAVVRTLEEATAPKPEVEEKTAASPTYHRRSTSSSSRHRTTHRSSSSHKTTSKRKTTSSKKKSTHHRRR
ncbi:hypothetical protein SAMN06265337_2771 [Hymenobacter gelipurpurascens]|uniref:Uncharacterized protein n=1 Tax=Hymenobacter gelipurpurascens TaxID=89968 RepID=A0A212UAA7_9BACT|nr:hypothetical protein [Hymenobacter gelipurpurascens]SNC75232.1 hypothetical protein SAMN06265337_2771 [Hymenobacter gelipurpurascens]